MCTSRSKNRGQGVPLRLSSFPSSLTYFLCFAGLAFLLTPLARAQESIVEAARNARQLHAASSSDRKIITNADLGAVNPVPVASEFHFATPSVNAAEAADPSVANPPAPLPCDNPQAQALGTELQATQLQLDQLRRELQYNLPVVSDNDLDPQYFIPGNSGFNVGAPPLLDAQPPAPARVTEVELQERIDVLAKALRVACEPPEGARIQVAIYRAEEELNLLQRQYALDQDDYYSKPVTEQIGGNPQLDAERQQIDELQSQIDGLKAELAAFLSLPGQD